MVQMSRRQVECEFLESRTLLSGTPPVTLLDSNNNVLASGSTFDFGTVQRPSTTVTKTIGIRNTSSDILTVSYDIPTEPFGLGGTPIIFGADRPVTIDPGQTGLLDLTVNPNILTLAFGELSYALDVTATDAATGTIFDTPATLTLTAAIVPAAPAATVSFSSHHPGTYTDAAGNVVMATLSGPGKATFDFASTGNADPSKLTFVNTTLATSVTITPPSTSAHTNIAGEVGVNGSIGKFIAPNVDLGGDAFTVSGGMKTLSIGNVTGLDLFSINGAAKTPFRFTGGKIADATLNSGEITSITVQSWTDTHQFDSNLGLSGEQIVVPSISKLSVGGDFTVGLQLFGSSAFLARATINGAVGSDSWTLAGDAGSVRIGSAPSTFSASAAGNIASLNINGDDAGTFAARDFGKIKIIGDLAGGKILAGANLGVYARVGIAGGNGMDSYSQGSIASIVVDGAATGAFISAGFESQDGLFDSATGTAIEGTASSISSIVIHGSVDATTRFVAGAFKTARIPGRVIPMTNSHFAILPPTPAD